MAQAPVNNTSNPLNTPPQRQLPPNMQSANMRVDKSADDLISSLKAKGSELTSKKVVNNALAENKNPELPVEPKIQESQDLDPDAMVQAHKPVPKEQDDYSIDIDKPEQPASPVVTEEPEDEEPVPEEALEPSERDAQFKKFRTRFTEQKKALKEKSQRLAALEKEVEDYRTGQVTPGLIEDKEAEIARLKVYEQIHNLEGSEEYQEAIIKPKLNAVGKLKEIAKDYGVPESVMDQALSLTNRAERNQFLAEHFDILGAQEVTALVNQIQDIEGKAKLARAKPAQTLQQMEQEQAQSKLQKRQQKRSMLAEDSKRAWAKTLHARQVENKIPELTLRENDEDHNTRFVKPIRQAAAASYSRLMRSIFDSIETGEPLSLETHEALASMVQLAHASGVAIDSREFYQKQAVEAEQALERTNSFMRPNIGSNRVSNSAPTKPAPVSPELRARALANQVMGSK